MFKMDELETIYISIDPGYLHQYDYEDMIFSNEGKFEYSIDFKTIYL
jgi:hypothetical protein